MELAKCGLNNEVNRLTVPVPNQVWSPKRARRDMTEWLLEPARERAELHRNLHVSCKLSQYPYSIITASLQYPYSISMHFTQYLYTSINQGEESLHHPLELLK